MGFADTIHVKLRPSPVLRVLNIALHGIALIVVGVLAAHRPLFWLLFASLGLMAWQEDCHLRLQQAGSCIGFRWAADHSLHWETKNGRSLNGKCIEARCWGALWVRLRIRETGRGRAQAVIVPADAVDAETHRRLRARCWIAPPEWPA